MVFQVCHLYIPNCAPSTTAGGNNFLTVQQYECLRCGKLWGYLGNGVRLVEEPKLRKRDERIKYWQNLYWRLADRFDKLDYDTTVEIERLKRLATCGCGDGFTETDRGTCGNCKVCLSVQIDRMEAEVDRLKAENAASLAALETIAKWEFDFRGDCVADARKVAQAEIDRAKGEQNDG